METPWYGHAHACRQLHSELPHLQLPMPQFAHICFCTLMLMLTPDHEPESSFPPRAAARIPHAGQRWRRRVVRVGFDAPGEKPPDLKSDQAGTVHEPEHFLDHLLGATGAGVDVRAQQGKAQLGRCGCRACLERSHQPLLLVGRETTPTRDRGHLGAGFGVGGGTLCGGLGVSASMLLLEGGGVLADGREFPVEGLLAEKVTQDSGVLAEGSFQVGFLLQDAPFFRKHAAGISEREQKLARSGRPAGHPRACGLP